MRIWGLYEGGGGRRTRAGGEESADDGAAQVADTAPWELDRIHQATRHPGPSITFPQLPLASSSSLPSPLTFAVPPLPLQSPTSVARCHSCPQYTSTSPPDPAGIRRLAVVFITQPPSSADRPSSWSTLTALAHTTLALSRSLSPCSCSRLIPVTPEEDRPFLSYAPSAGLVSLPWVLLPPDRLASAHRRLEGCEHSADSSTLVPPYNPRVRHPSVFPSCDVSRSVIWTPFRVAHSTSFHMSCLILYPPHLLHCIRRYIWLVPDDLCGCV